MTARNTRKPAAAKPAAAAIVGFTAEQQAGLRTAVAAAVKAAGKQEDAKKETGSATGKLIAAFANRDLLAHRFEFQARDRKGNVTETKTASLYDYARKAAPFYTKGKEERARVTGFRLSVLGFAGVNNGDSDIARKAWDNFKGFALPAAIALADCQIAAAMTNGKLALSGGNGTAAAAKLMTAASKSTTALTSLVRGKGTNKPKVAAATGKAAQAATVAKAQAMDIDAAIRAAAVYLQKVSCGDDAITNKRLGLLKAIARDAAAILAQEAKAAAKPAAAKVNLADTLNDVLKGKLAAKA